VSYNKTLSLFQLVGGVNFSVRSCHPGMVVDYVLFCVLLGLLVEQAKPCEAHTDPTYKT
jgi:hypothetical protein